MGSGHMGSDPKYDVAMTIQQRIDELGLVIPEVPKPVANYLPAVRVGNEMRTSGQIPMKNGNLMFKGSVPSAQSIEAATEAATICGLNAIAAAAELLGSLEAIVGVSQLRVFIASDVGFEGHSTIANGVSDLMVSIFGDAGRHSRVAMGSIGLPLGATVEVEAVFEVR